MDPSLHAAYRLILVLVLVLDFPIFRHRLFLPLNFRLGRSLPLDRTRSSGWTGAIVGSLWFLRRRFLVTGHLGDFLVYDIRSARDRFAEFLKEHLELLVDLITPV
jgi:hypothetical protein